MLKYLLKVAQSLLLIGGFSASFAARAEDLAEQAAKSYQNGNFSDSVRIYLNLVDRFPNSASLYHNLGSAFYRNGELGASVAAYLRAEQLNPRDPDIQYNLKLLLAKGSDKLEASLPETGWRRLMVARLLTERELFYASVLLFASGAIGGAIALRRGQHKVAILSAILPLWLLSAYCGGNLYYKSEVSYPWAAVGPAEIAVYSSPTEKNAVVIFKLHTGAPCALLEKSGDWYKIKLSDQKTGWVAGTNLIFFGPEGRNYHPLDEQSPSPPNSPT